MTLDLLRTLVRNGASPYALLWRIGGTGSSLPQARQTASGATVGPADAERGVAGRLGGFAAGEDGSLDPRRVNPEGIGQLVDGRAERSLGGSVPQSSDGAGSETCPLGERLVGLASRLGPQQVLEGLVSCHAEQGSRNFQRFPTEPLDFLPKSAEDSPRQANESRPEVIRQDSLGPAAGNQQRKPAMSHASNSRRIPSSIPSRFRDHGVLCILSAGIACMAIVEGLDAGPGLSAGRELADISEPWLRDPSEWEACFAEPPTPEAIKRALDEALDEVEHAAFDAVDGTRIHWDVIGGGL